MKILVTADLHYGKHAVFDQHIEKFAQRVNETEADILILAGDTGVFGSKYAEALHLFDDFNGRKLMIAGNHDLWTKSGDSFGLYQEGIPALAAEFGFHSLDKSPVIIGSVGIAGTIGWYDYSYASSRLLNSRLGIDLEKKTVGGKIVWNDARFIRMDYSDEGFTEFLVHKVRRDLDFLSDRVDQIVFISHHVPFENMIFKQVRLPWALVNVYLGSKRFGELLLQYEKVKYLFCGHSHYYVSCENRHIKCVNVGSTYRKKRFEVLQI